MESPLLIHKFQQGLLPLRFLYPCFCIQNLYLIVISWLLIVYFSFRTGIFQISVLLNIPALMSGIAWLTPYKAASAYTIISSDNAISYYFIKIHDSNSNTG